MNAPVLGHIAVLSPYRHANSAAGAWIRAVNLCRCLVAEKDIAVTTLAPAPLAEGASHIDFDLEGSLLSRVLKLVRLNLILHRLRPALVISESPLVPLSLGRFKTVHVIHDTKYATARSRRGNALRKLFHATSASLADAILTVSESEADNIRRLYGEGKTIIRSYNGIGNMWFERMDLDESSRDEYDIIYVSNFASHKGHIALLEAIHRCNYRIALVGNDFGMGREIRQAAETLNCRIDYFCNLPEPELIALYDRSKIFVFPSALEGFGIPFLEARSRGLRVVANDIPVFRELADILGGTIVDCSNTAALATAIEQALAARARQFPEKETLRKFQWQTITTALLEDFAALNLLPQHDKRSKPTDIRTI
jgi:glycosyltransferase involved in cell wall biosynthesis